MYWYKSKTLLTAAVCSAIYLTSGLQACKPDLRDNPANHKYFDVKGFFERDSARLTQLNKPVLKTVWHNGVKETKTVHIANWGTELSLFKESDINKPAWKNSYRILGDSSVIIYKAIDTTLNTKEILIKKAGGKVKYIMIVNTVEKRLYKKKFLLYSTIEKLSYFPDSLYEIQKTQTVRLLGTNRYQIKGYFNQ